MRSQQKFKSHHVWSSLALNEEGPKETVPLCKFARHSSPQRQRPVRTWVYDMPTHFAAISRQNVIEEAVCNDFCLPYSFENFLRRHTSPMSSNVHCTTARVLKCLGHPRLVLKHCSVPAKSNISQSCHYVGDFLAHVSGHYATKALNAIEWKLKSPTLLNNATIHRFARQNEQWMLKPRALTVHASSLLKSISKQSFSVVQSVTVNPNPNFPKCCKPTKNYFCCAQAGTHDDQWLPKVAYDVFIFNIACIGTNASTSQERKTTIKGNHKWIIALINSLYYKTVSEENVMVSIPHTSVTIEHTVKMAPGYR